MPQLVKGAKWVFGWVVVGPDGWMTIPPQAWREYGFQVGTQAFFIRGSRRSGGFGLSAPDLLAASSLRDAWEKRLLAQGWIEREGCVKLPPEMSIKPGEQLLTVRGSGYALGFVAQGPIYQEALKQTERLERFE